MNGYFSKWLLVSAASLLVLVSSVSSAPPLPQDQPPDNVAGNWTIYSKDIDKNGSATKFVTIIQKGNVLTGHFKGPNQSGGIQGSINVHHIVFATKTRNVLTFRGTVDGDKITGMYGLHGQHAEFQAVRQN
jgi:hypothetical protein